MGIDCEILVTGPVTPAMIERANARLDRFLYDRASMFGNPVYNNRFIILLDDDNTTYGEPGDAYFMTMWRYYGPAYERGPFPLILGTLMVAVEAFPGCIVHYNGDNVEEPVEWSLERMVFYMRHYMGESGEAYSQRFAEAARLLTTFRRNGS